MNNSLKLKIIIKAIKIKISRGEELNYILNDYKELTEKERKYIVDNIV